MILLKRGSIAPKARNLLMGLAPALVIWYINVRGKSITRGVRVVSNFAWCVYIYMRYVSVQKRDPE